MFLGEFSPIFLIYISFDSGKNSSGLERQERFFYKGRKRKFLL